MVAVENGDGRRYWHHQRVAALEIANWQLHGSRYLDVVRMYKSSVVRQVSGKVASLEGILP